MDHVFRQAYFQSVAPLNQAEITGFVAQDKALKYDFAWVILSEIGAVA